MVHYEFRTPLGDTADQLIGLSRRWVEENCSYGIVINEEADLSEPLVVALDGDRIIGYCFGHYYNQEKRTSCIAAGSTCFSIDELYVLPEYRRSGIGKRLFQMLEEEVKSQCSYITLTTSTKNYKGILKLYVDELEMNFHNAFLIKNLEDKPCE